ncbi:hypothetical protein ACFUCQ_00745 [Streptomyces sp. NPDC057197]|uniref:hypothetical protein n=1 Tax=Streptomyces sp. NPDC057197 TaxID=3346045 RepID=UPI003630ED0E
MSARPTRARPARARVRLLAATVLVLAASAALTGCDDGEGVRDEGPSTDSASLGRPCATAAVQPGPQRSFCATSTAQ